MFPLDTKLRTRDSRKAPATILRNDLAGAKPYLIIWEHEDGSSQQSRTCSESELDYFFEREVERESRFMLWNDNSLGFKYDQIAGTIQTNTYEELRPDIVEAFEHGQIRSDATVIRIDLENRVPIATAFLHIGGGEIPNDWVD